MPGAGGVVDAGAGGGHDALHWHWPSCCHRCATLASRTIDLSSPTVVRLAGMVAAFVCLFVCGCMHVFICILC